MWNRTRDFLWRRHLIWGDAGWWDVLALIKENLKNKIFCSSKQTFFSSAFLRILIPIISICFIDFNAKENTADNILETKQSSQSLDFGNKNNFQPIDLQCYRVNNNNNLWELKDFCLMSANMKLSVKKR